jgi:hypothetical protein
MKKDEGVEDNQLSIINDQLLIFNGIKGVEG